MRLGGTLAAATAMASAGCQMPTEEVVPHHERPEDGNQLGKPRFYATVIAGIPVLTRTRENRPILVAPHSAHPSPRGLTVRAQASLLDLYDPDRAKGPSSVRRGQGALVPTSWQAVGQALLTQLKEAKGEAVLLTPTATGPATKHLLAELERVASIRHVSYAAVDDDVAWSAWQAAFGSVPRPRPRLDRASLIVGFGAEFIDRPADGLEQDFASRRGPDATGGMSQFVAFEGRLTLTGANADRRVRVRDSQLAAVAGAIAHEIVVTQRQGPLAEDESVVAALGAYAPAAVANAAGVDAGVLVALADRLIGAKGKALVLAGGSASQSTSGLALELLTIIINLCLGAYDSPLFDRAMAQPGGASSAAVLVQLAEQLQAGKVSTLIVAGVNPVYDGPARAGFAAAMAKCKLVVSLNDRLDETTGHADWHAPVSHPLEAWGDVQLDGTLVAIQQPVIRPLHDTYGLLDVLVTWGAALGVGGAVSEAVAQSQTPAAADKAALPTSQSAGYHFLRAYWGAEVLKQKPDTPAFEDVWAEVLRKGYWAGSPPDDPEPVFAPEALAKLGAPEPSPELELQLYPHYALHDGTAANNGWLLELPDPITRITWDGAVSVAPRRFDELGLENGDLVELTVGSAKLELPAYRHAGMHHDQLAVALGQGRSAVGLVGDGVGVNAFTLAQLEGGRLIRAGLPVGIRGLGKSAPLAIMQGSEVIDRDRRPLVPTATLSQYRADPKAGTEQTPGGASAWPEHPYEGTRWEMAIDLSKCNGCGKCALACQGENNIPVVGPDGIRNGREMCWMRIDRYYDAPPKEGRWGGEVWDGPLEVVEEPVTLFEPMLCQHCENAPCETVCPFNATMHSEDGLNQQIYNRCVGTRYCANNCPFKVRRYNWFEYSYRQSSELFRRLFPVMEDNANRNARGKLALKNNPEVTVRTRGVMEKCTFCVQRIREARAEALRQGRKGTIPDGAVLPACMEACPTGAIVFGDVNDKSSRVAALAKSPRAMRLLELIGVKPAISYLTKVRNDDA
ncbi:MAG: 4Fe-4S dicluster domain-containing protein [Deltaproteobacteria bacterium]|nr:4Fe-4S dicluster domain-containing protein [Deltaproteobacteria bacterium]